VDAGVDFLAQDLLGALDGQNGHLLAQGFTGLDDLLLGFCTRCGDDLGGLFRGAALGLLDDGQSATLGISQARSGLGARLGQLGLDALIGRAQLDLALSAAARPSAIFFARSSSAAVIGGQTNFIVNPTKIRNTII